MAAANIQSPTMGDRSKTSSPSMNKPPINNSSGMLSSLLLSAFSHQLTFAPYLRVAGASPFPPPRILSSLSHWIH
jgi:hypothetical protein